MRQKLRAAISIVRPRQWIKNFALFTPIFFSGRLFEWSYFSSTSIGVVAFCLLSASGYIANDLFDVESDKSHPFKRYRALARGTLTVPEARLLLVCVTVLGGLLSAFIGPFFLIIAMLFLLLRYVNTLVLRKISLLDILVITASYTLRVYAGVAATGQAMSIWLALTMVSLSLLLAIGKRRAEYALAKKQEQKGSKIFVHYSEQMLNSSIAMFATATFLTYTFYTFQAGAFVTGISLLSEQSISGAVAERKWMMLTIPFVLYGIMRYLQLVYENEKNTLEKVVTMDIPLMVTVSLWVLSIFLVQYRVGL